MSAIFKFILMGAMLLPAALFAQVPEVDTAEAIRRGPMVTHSGMGARDADEQAVIKANAPPADDSSVWHIVIIKQQNCPPCAQLLEDIKKSQELLAFVAAPDGVLPWAHLHVYDSADETQQEMIRAYNATAYPAIYVRPPRSGVWGPPESVVMAKIGYTGPKQLAKDITTHVRIYAKAMARKGYPKTINALSYESEMTSDFVSHGSAQRTAPFAVPPAVDPFRPQNYPAVAPAPFGPPTEPEALSAAQIQALIAPANDAQFVVEQLTKKANDPAAVLQEWIKKQSTKKEEEKPAETTKALTFEEIQAIAPTEDPALIAVVAASKPTSKDQVIQLIADAKKKESEAKPVGALDFIASVASSAIQTFLGPQVATALLWIGVAIGILAFIAPRTPTKVDDQALQLLKDLKDGLGGKTPTDPGQSLKP